MDSGIARFVSSSSGCAYPGTIGANIEAPAVMHGTTSLPKTLPAEIHALDGPFQGSDRGVVFTLPNGVETL
jgi:hypothetical protein